MNSMQWWSAPEGQACELHLAFLKQGLTRPASQSSFPPGHTPSQPRYEKGLSPSFWCSRGAAQPGAPPRQPPAAGRPPLGSLCSWRSLARRSLPTLPPPHCPEPCCHSYFCSSHARLHHGVSSFTALTRCEQVCCGLALYLLEEPQGRPRVVVTSSDDGVKLQHRKQWPLML